MVAFVASACTNHKADDFVQDDLIRSVPMILLDTLGIPVPEGIQYGQFVELNGCLVLRIGEKEFAPVFVGAGANYDIPAGAVAKFQGRRLPLDVTIAIGGGSMDRAVVHARLTPRQRAALCREDVFVVTQY